MNSTVDYSINSRYIWRLSFCQKNETSFRYRTVSHSSEKNKCLSRRWSFMNISNSLLIPWRPKRGRNLYQKIGKELVKNNILRKGLLENWNIIQENRWKKKLSDWYHTWTIWGTAVPWYAKIAQIWTNYLEKLRLRVQFLVWVKMTGGLFLSCFDFAPASLSPFWQQFNSRVPWTEAKRFKASGALERVSAGDGQSERELLGGTTSSVASRKPRPHPILQHPDGPEPCSHIPQ